MVRSKSPKSDKLRPLFIVTPRRVENDMLNLFLEQATGSKCQTVECIEHIEPMQAENHPLGTVILLDCFGKDKETILTELNSCYQQMSFQYLLGLFNLSPDIGIESETVRQGVKALFYEDDSLITFSKESVPSLKGKFGSPERLWLNALRRIRRIQKRKT